jgi:YD repeat-containing protein
VETNCNGTPAAYQYAAAGRRTLVEDANLDSTATVYDKVGNVTATVDARGKETDYFFDNANRRTAVQDADSHVATTAYDQAGNILSVQDANLNVTTFGYDSENRRTLVQDGLGNVTTTLYDRDGNVTSVEDANHNVTSYFYDDDSLKTRMIDPQMHAATYHYDHDLRMDYTLDRNGRRRDFVYRDDGLLLVETWRNSGGTVVDTLTYTYDADGNLLTAANTASLYTFGYDPDNRLTNVQEPFGLALTYGYDQADRVTTVQDSKGGVLTSVYDAGHRLTNRQFSASGSPSLSVKVDWTPRDEPGTVTYYKDLNYSQAAGRTLYDSYDDAVIGQLKHLRHQNADGSAVLGDFTYSYDPGQRLTTQVLDGVATVYGYDAADRLTSENGSPYGYDAAGNRNDAGFVPTLSNQLQQDSTFTYGYDAEGNLLSKVNKSTGETTTYTYDNVNHLLSMVDTMAGLEIDYKYDALGQRIERQQVAGGHGQPGRALRSRPGPRRCEQGEFVLLPKEGPFDGKDPLPPIVSLDRSKCLLIEEPDLDRRMGGSSACGTFRYKHDAIVVGQIRRRPGSDHPVRIGDLWLIVTQDWENWGQGRMPLVNSC